MIDARRMEVYCLVADASLQIIQPTHAKVIEETSFSDLLDSRRIIFFGNGADKCEQVIQHENAQFYKDVNLNATSLGVLAFKKFEKSIFEDLAQFEPFYGKDFVAKRAKSIFG
jgi:tRNA threonylcarbamoyladenosine biosynthesis protein TsaB